MAESEDLPKEVIEDDDESMSSSDDENDDELSEQEQKQVQSLKDAILKNPYDYDSYLTLIGLLKKAGEFLDLRSVRKSFAEHYPLSSEIWLDWIQDELKVATSPEEKEHIESLFRKAVKDYTSVELWLEFCQFSLAQLGAEGGLQKIRGVFEEAVVNVGVHVAKGSLIWETYREFENALLMATPKNQDQMNIVDKIFRRQLVVPLLNMEATYGEYIQWLSEMGLGTIDPNIERGYKAARELLKTREPFEDSLIQAKDQSNVRTSLETYQDYIKEELKLGNPVRIQSIYERQITDHCLVPKSWLEYSDYLENNLKNLDHAMQIYNRAIRNCPWSGTLWIRLLRCCEKLSLPLDTCRKHMEAALSAGLSTPTEYRDLWLAFIDFRRRGMKLDEEDDEAKKEKEIEELREIFNRAIEQLATVAGDPDSKIARYWASVEADRFRSMEKARQIWSEIVSGPVGERAKFWIEYINLEKLFGDTKHLKKLFPRALDKSKDWPEEVAEIWIQFEREEGTLESFEEAETKINGRLEAIKAIRAAKEDEQNAKLESKKERQREKRKEYRNKDKDKETNDRKRKFDNKEQSNGEPVFKKPSLPVATASISKNESEVVPPPGFKKDEIKPPPGFPKDNIKPPPGFKEDKVAPPPGFKGQTTSTSSTSKPEETSSQSSKAEDRTVFISNLDFSLTEQQLMKVFSKCGDVIDVRLVKNFGGKSKGYGFVEFKTPQAAISALQMDNEPIDGRPIYVSVNDPNKKGHQFKYSTNLEKNKLFVKGIVTSATKEDLESLFAPFGSIKAVRLVTFRNGHSKGIAYVEYNEEASAKTAILKLDNYEYKGQNLSVAISNPPTRKDATKTFEAPTRSLGGGNPSEPVGSRGRGRTQLSFVPRSVQKSSTSTQPEQPSNGSTKNMSNSEFRNMLLNSKK